MGRRALACSSFYLQQAVRSVLFPIPWKITIIQSKERPMGGKSDIQFRPDCSVEAKITSLKPGLYLGRNVVADL
jgi:hypothetical protein